MIFEKKNDKPSEMVYNDTVFVFDEAAVSPAEKIFEGGVFYDDRPDGSGQ